MPYISNAKDIINKEEKHECLCDEPTCVKCLSTNCRDTACLVHTKQAKESWRKRWEDNNKREFPHPKKLLNRHVVGTGTM